MDIIVTMIVYYVTATGTAGFHSENFVRIHGWTSLEQCELSIDAAKVAVLSGYPGSKVAVECDSAPEWV